MNLPAIALSESAAFILAVTRLSGFVITSPFPSKNVPVQIKVGLVLMLAWVVRSTEPASPLLSLDLKMLGLVPGEIGIGILIGFTVRITFSAAELLGSSFAQSTGLTMAQVYDPTLGTEDPVPARVVSLFAMLIFFAMGAHRVALAYTLESFRVLPIGQAVDISIAAPSIVDFIAHAMDAGVRLSLPVMAVALAVQVTLALVARAAPSLQVFSIGMGVTVAAGFLAIIGSLHDASAGLSTELQQEAPRIEQVLGGLSPAP